MLVTSELSAGTRSWLFERWSRFKIRPEWIPWMIDMISINFLACYGNSSEFCVGPSPACAGIAIRVGSWYFYQDCCEFHVRQHFPALISVVYFD